LGCALVGRQALQSVTRTIGVVFLDPGFNDQAHLLKRTEHVGIKHIFSKRAVEALNVSILPAPVPQAQVGWLAGLGPLNSNQYLPIKSQSPRSSMAT
jgi:hypothetical protein